MAQAKEVDIIITTALIPGKPAPKLITNEVRVRIDFLKPSISIQVPDGRCDEARICHRRFGCRDRR